MIPESASGNIFRCDEVDGNEFKTLYCHDYKRYNLYDTKCVTTLYNLRWENKV
jgi:hypothetical protein